MKLRLLAVATCVSGTAAAGGLLIPGAGPESTSRAGASTVASEDGEALALNPANVAKTKGTVITFGFSAIGYSMSFTANGAYDDLSNDPFGKESVSYAGQRYPTMTNNPSPAVAIPGTSYVPVPVIAITSDLGNIVPGLHAGFGLYAPNAYPFRDMNTVNGQPYFTTNKNGAADFPGAFGAPPPPTRYDVIHQEAAIILPSVVVAYRVLPQLDVGGRFSAGFAQLKASAAVWGQPGNYNENIKADGLDTLVTHDNFIPEWALGATFRATENLEFGVRYTSELDVHSKGDAYAINGPEVSIGGSPVVLLPRTGFTNGLPNFLCEDGGTMTAQKACLDIALPQTATVGGRWKFVDEKGAEKGDVEVDVDWENWGKTCDLNAQGLPTDTSCASPTDYRVTVDATVATQANPTGGVDLKPQLLRHGFQNTYAVRAGGSWKFPMGDNMLVVRGGLGYDTAAAKKGWERADIDGAARTMIAAGASYDLKSWKIHAGLAAILEGTRTDSRTCNPTTAQMGCAGTPGYSGGTPGTDNTPPNRQGPDPVNPIIYPNTQAENPINIGTFTSHYLLFMLGATYAF